jgi:hypothetical protein
MNKYLLILAIVIAYLIWDGMSYKVVNNSKAEPERELFSNVPHESTRDVDQEPAYVQELAYDAVQESRLQEFDSPTKNVEKKVRFSPTKEILEFDKNDNVCRAVKNVQYRYEMDKTEPIAIQGGKEISKEQFKRIRGYGIPDDTIPIGISSDIGNIALDESGVNNFDAFSRTAMYSGV